MENLTRIEKEIYKKASMLLDKYDILYQIKDINDTRLKLEFEGTMVLYIIYIDLSCNSVLSCQRPKASQTTQGYNISSIDREEIKFINELFNWWYD